MRWALLHIEGYPRDESRINPASRSLGADNLPSDLSNQEEPMQYAWTLSDCVPSVLSSVC